MAVSNDPAHMFGAPIPGASLTKTPGGAPWQSPPQFTDEDEALHYIWEVVFQKPEAVVPFMVFLKKGIAVTEIVNTFLFAGVAASKWTLDLAMLMYQEVAWMICALAKIRGIKYTFKRLQPSYADFLVEYKDYIAEPAKEPVKAATTKMFATGLGLDNETTETAPDNESAGE
jgi:PhoPQ-activated pathogenicity-related protein